MQTNKLIFSILTTVFLSSCGPKDGEYELHLLATNDIHGAYFDSTYVSSITRNSLLAIHEEANRMRSEYGSENVILIDAGDFLQGDNASYYFNYVDTIDTHIYSRMAKYMGYDVVAMGNHDIETGHPIYDRVRNDLERDGIPVLGGNAIRNDNGERYFPEFTMLKRHGIKIAVLGYNNANISAWLNEKQWSGMTFKSLIPLVQEDVDRITDEYSPQVVIVAVHSGTGKGDGSVRENQGMDLFNSLQGVDILVCSHDHSPCVVNSERICLINSGSHCRNLGHGIISLSFKDGKVVSKSIDSELITIDKNLCDNEMRANFQEDYNKVKAFTRQEIGTLETELKSREAFAGPSDYINLIHKISLESTDAQISFAAPLSQNGIVKAGTIIYNDLFTIYPFENQLYKIRLSGQEILDYLEYSYDSWITTATSADNHVLNIKNVQDLSSGNRRWTFAKYSYNFDSAAGINYVVDVTKPYGSRITISSLADGTAFSLESEYTVALTSYRASGGGDLLAKGAGVETNDINDRIIDTYPEIRNLLYEYILQNGTISPSEINDTSILGNWSFVPENIANPAIERDMALLFGE